MYGYNILYIKKINIYTHYTLLITRVKPTLTLSLHATVTLIKAKRHPRCALLMLTLGCICGMITAQPHYRSAVSTLAFSLNREPTPVHFVSPTM